MSLVANSILDLGFRTTHGGPHCSEGASEMPLGLKQPQCQLLLAPRKWAVGCHPSWSSTWVPGGGETLIRNMQVEIDETDWIYVDSFPILLPTDDAQPRG